MLKISQTRRSRLKIVISFGVILALLTGYAMYKGMEGPATLGVTAIGALVAKYSHDETKNPSLKK